MDAYLVAQEAMARLKSAVRHTLANGPAEGMTNVQIGKTLGIYAGHVGHVGHIPRTMLALLQDEGVVDQDPETKKWSLLQQGDDK